MFGEVLESITGARHEVAQRVLVQDLEGLCAAQYTAGALRQGAPLPRQAALGVFLSKPCGRELLYRQAQDLAWWHEVEAASVGVDASVMVGV